MSKERYIKIKSWFECHKTALSILRFNYKVLPLVMFVAVPVLIIWKAFLGIDHDFFRMIYIPAFILVLVTVMRKIMNKPRPYEVYNTEPVFKRDGKGQSMPSRHTASAFIIAMCAIPVSLPLTIFLIIISLLIALSRILAGVHFISDVIAGFLISVITGLIFFIIL